MKAFKSLIKTAKHQQMLETCFICHLLRHNSSLRDNFGIQNFRRKHLKTNEIYGCNARVKICLKHLYRNSNINIPAIAEIVLAMFQVRQSVRDHASSDCCFLFKIIILLDWVPRQDKRGQSSLLFNQQPGKTDSYIFLARKESKRNERQLYLEQCVPIVITVIS